MKRIGMVFFLLIVVTGLFGKVVFAAPVYDFPVVVIQPDESELNALVSGDEHFNYMHDADGNLIRMNDEGWYVYLAVDSEGRLEFTDIVPGAARGRSVFTGVRADEINFGVNAQLVREPFRMPQEELFAPLSAPLSAPGQIGIVNPNSLAGDMNAVVLMICFSDEDDTMLPAELNALERIFNTGDSTNGSLSEYMFTVSGELLRVNTILVGMNGDTTLMYRDIEPRAYYQPYNASTNPDGYSNDAEARNREFELISRAVESINGSSLLAGLNLDADDNGAIDVIHFIISGSTDAWSDLLWPHAWFPWTNSNGDPINLLSTTLNGKVINTYSFQIANTMFNGSGVSVAVHETLHTFNYPDLYRHYVGGTPVGGWDVMAQSESNPQFPNAHSRLRHTGWGSPLVEITQSGNYTLYPTGSSGGTTAFAIATENPDEFILLEYRSGANGSRYDTYFGTGIGYHRGLTIARINTRYSGSSGPGRAEDIIAENYMDEVYYFRPNDTVINHGGASNGTIRQGSFSSTTGREAFGNAANYRADVSANPAGYIYLTDGTNTGLAISNVSATAGTISFDVFVPGAALDVTAPTFAAVDYGYTTRPAAQTITIANTGDSVAAISNVQVDDDNAFEILGSGASVPGGGSITSYTIQPRAGLDAGTYNATITVTYSGTSAATTATADVSFTVNQASAPVFSWPAATALTYGQQLSDSALSFASNDYGTFVWASPATIPTVTNSGYGVTFTPSANTIKNYQAISQLTQTVSITVSRASQTGFAFSDPNPAAQTYSAGFTYSNTAAGGGGDGAITYSITGGTGLASIDTSTGQIHTVTRAGTIAVSASKAESDNHLSATATYTLTINKETQNAPASLTVTATEATNVTLNPVGGAEYRVSGGTWQDSNLITGLTPNTPYTFEVRYKETDTHFASAATSVSGTTLRAQIVGSVSIAGGTVFGETLTAVTTALSATPSVTLGDLSYQWHRNGNNITVNGNAATYVLVEADIGAVITVTVTAANCDGSVMSSATAVIAMATQAAPEQPSVESRTSTSITLNTIPGAMFRIDGETWQPVNTFTNLQPGTSYTFEAYFPATSSHNASGVSSVLTASTALAALGGTVSIPDDIYFGNTITANTDDLTSTPNVPLGNLSYQWRRGGVNIPGANASIYTITAEDINSLISVSVSAENCEESVVSNERPAKKLGQNAPAIHEGTITNNGEIYFYTMNISPTASNAQFSMNGGDWQSSNIFEVTPGTSTTFFAQFAETATHFAGNTANTGEINFPKLQRAEPAVDYTRAGDWETEGVTVTITNPSSNAEYSIDGINFGAANTFSFDPGVESVTLYARILETSTHFASAAAQLDIFFTKQNQNAPANVSLNITDVYESHYIVTIDPVAGANAEYSFDGVSFSASIPSVNADAGETVTAYVLYAGDAYYNQSGVTTATQTMAQFTLRPPTINPNGGTFIDFVSVTISADPSDSSIFYTTDGSIPTSESTLYDGAFELTQTSTVNAFTVKQGRINSDVVTATFTRHVEPTPSPTPMPTPTPTPAPTQRPSTGGGSSGSGGGGIIGRQVTNPAVRDSGANVSDVSDVSGTGVASSANDILVVPNENGLGASASVGSETAVSSANPVSVTAEIGDVGELNPHRFVATAEDGTIIGGSLNPETGVFTFNATAPGNYTISYVETLNRLSLQIGRNTIVCLAENAETEYLDVAPAIIDGRTMLPLRGLANALGAEISWNEETRDVTIINGDRILVIPIGFNTPELSALGMDVPAQIIDGRTMVPARFIAEFFGAVVDWNAETRTMEIISR